MKEGQLLNRLQRLLLQVRGLARHERAWVRLPTLAVEACGLTALALGVVSSMGLDQVGVFGLFLTAASLTPRFQQVLQDNKDRIILQEQPSRAANASTAVSILAVFVGICLGYLLCSLAFSDQDLATWFGFIFSASGGLGGNLLNRDFSQLRPILNHNFVVLGTVAVLCLLYRSYGALLTLGWNACVWVIVLVSLTRPLLGESLGEQVAVSLWAVLAIAPHLVLEGAAYVLIALAAIFYSKGVTRYLVPLNPRKPESMASMLVEDMPSEDVFFDISVSCLKLAVAAAVVLVIAGLVEVFYATWVLALLREWVGA